MQGTQNTIALQSCNLVNVFPLWQVWGLQRWALKKQLRLAQIAVAQQEKTGTSTIYHIIHDTVRATALIQCHRHTLASAITADLGAGLYTRLTLGILKGSEIAQFEDGVWQSTGVRIECTEKTIWESALGWLVENNGRGISGTQGVVCEVKKILRPMLHHARAMPSALVSITTDDGRHRVIYGQPVSCYKGELVTQHYLIDLDGWFYPCEIDGEHGHCNYKAQTKFIHSLAGLTAVLMLGSRKVSQIFGYRSPIDISTAARIATFLQAAYELEYFTNWIKTLPGGIQINNTQDARENLYPGAPWYKILEAIELTTWYLAEGIKALNLGGDLIRLCNAHGKPLIMLPANTLFESPTRRHLYNRGKSVIIPIEG